MVDNPKTGKKLIHDKELKLWHRGDGDLGIVKEQKSWHPLTEVNLRGKPVLDLGGHIGTFVWYMLQHTQVRTIVSVEPDPNNIRVYRKNHPDGMLLEAAVLHNASPTTELYLGKTYPAANSVEPFRGRQTITVPVIEWTKLLKMRVWAVIKCDIEGAEYLLDWSLLPACVQAVALEFHYHRPDWHAKQKKVHKDLLKLGFKVVRDPVFNSYTKVCFAHYRREV